MKLIICGNGFDRNHGLHTGYCSYRAYLEKNAPNILEKFELFPFLNSRKISEKWKDVEDTLRINAEAFVQMLNSYQLFESEENVIECGIDIEEWMNFLFAFTGELFYKWLQEIDITKLIPKREIEELFEDAVFITFNYTDTLENVYGISKERIVHIHGNLLQVNQQECIGQDIFSVFSTIEEAECYNKPIVKKEQWNSYVIRKEIQFGAPVKVENLMNLIGVDNIPDKDIREYVSEVLPCLIKNIENNIPVLRKFIDGKNIEEVIVLGHSLNGPDDLYYTECLLPLYREKKWTFYWHRHENSEEDLCEKKLFCQRHKIANCEYREW